LSRPTVTVGGIAVAGSDTPRSPRSGPGRRSMPADATRAAARRPAADPRCRPPATLAPTRPQPPAVQLSPRDPPADGHSAHTDRGGETERDGIVNARAAKRQGQWVGRRVGEVGYRAHGHAGAG